MIVHYMVCTVRPAQDMYHTYEALETRFHFLPVSKETNYANKSEISHYLR